MKLFQSIISLALLGLSLSCFAKDITLQAEDGFPLKVSYYPSDVKSKQAVLLLHQCNFNRTMYDQIGQQLAAEGIHALSLDFRGFGESSNDEFDIEKVQALPREERRKAWRKISVHWPSDVQLAYNFLTSQTSGKAITGVIGASCGGSQAITLAENNSISVIGFFSSSQREENIKRYKQVDRKSVV